MSQVVVMSPEEVKALVVLAIKEVIPDKPADRIEKRLLSGQDVENEYGIPRRTLERWRMDGTGPTYTPVGGKVFYERALLDQYIISGRVKTSDYGA